MGAAALVQDIRPKQPRRVDVGVADEVHHHVEEQGRAEGALLSVERCPQRPGEVLDHGRGTGAIFCRLKPHLDTCVAEARVLSEV